MAGLWRHPRSKMYWFRMGVPERYRERVGKREWKETLGTADLVEARSLHARKLHEVQELMRTLDAGEAIAVDDQADKIVADGFDALARANVRAHEIAADYDLARGLDHVCFTMLQMMGFRARLDWGGSYASKAQDDMLGEADEDIWPIEQPDAAGAFPTFAHRDAVAMNIELFENNPLFRGAAFREVARAHLSARDWKAAEFEAQIVAQAAGVVLRPKGPLFEAVAERILRRLAEHRFGHWPTGVQNVLQPMMTAMATHLPAPTIVDQDAPAHTLSDALAAWKKRKGIDPALPNKTADEWQSALDRFRELAGTEDVAAITGEMVETFLEDVAQLPYRPKKVIGSLPLRQQIAAAHAAKLPTLGPSTVGKHLAAIRSLLATAVRKKWIPFNPAAGLSVEGAKHTGTERDHFSDEDMRRIYTAPLMTDPDACSDTMFWILLLAPFHGSRPGEHCKLKPHEVIREDDEWVMRFRSDRKRQSSAEGPEKRPRRQKTGQSVRDVPIHWIVVESGFLDWVALQIERGEQWVFSDLTADKYGDRYKYLSREINDAIRALGIDDPDKSFYSTRHNFKREGRRRRVSEHDLDQMAGMPRSTSAGNTGRVRRSTR
ncbi:DUF6538 domain-containing protein [Sphingomonas jeddahensis]|uniref:DUF6538 domain-containing protein n=1 Tax=Sphingomonas jeddahensis TaxID=1915074 RepID=UPI001301710D|nr:DUF6538 domain-containing protein [Sphingomonas jeddahensis]